MQIYSLNYFLAYQIANEKHLRPNFWCVYLFYHIQQLYIIKNYEFLFYSYVFYCFFEFLMYFFGFFTFV